MSRVTIVLADDHHIVRQGLRMLLETDPEFAVVGEEADGLKVVDLVKRVSPDVLVLDLMLPGEDGLAICRRLRAAGNPVPAVICGPRIWG